MSIRDKKFAIGDSRDSVIAPRTIRSSVLLAFAEVAKENGVEPYSLLRKTGLPTTVLQDPDLQIPEAKFRQLLDLASQISDLPHFSLLLGAKAHLGMSGSLGLLMREQPTVRHAIEAMARYQRYQNDTVEIALEDRGDALIFSPRILSGEGAAHGPAMDLTMAIYVRYLSALLGETWKPRQARLRRDPPADAGPYFDILGDVMFGAERDSLIFDASDIDTPIPTADPLLAREIARFLEARPVRDDGTFSDKVRDLIIRMLSSGSCTIDNVANQLGVDRRTIHRKLQVEGSSFSELLTATRQALIAAELGRRDETLSEVAQKLGFSSLSTFSRWFRQVYGMKASEFKAGPR